MPIANDGNGGSRERAVYNCKRVRMRLTVARLRRWPARCARRSNVRGAALPRDRELGGSAAGRALRREERSWQAAAPPRRKRRTHLAADCRLSLNSLQPSRAPSPAKICAAVSTVNREAGMMVDSPFGLLGLLYFADQLPSSRTDGQQRLKTSHLALKPGLPNFCRKLFSRAEGFEPAAHPT